MRSGMRTITDVNIDGRAVDLAVDNVLTFTNNCDCASYIILDWYDTDTHEHTATTVGDGITTSWKNGDTVRLALTSERTPGHDYMCVPTIFQARYDVPEDEESPGKYDVYMGAGRIQQSSADPKTVYIDRDISFIIKPKRHGEVLVGGCVLRLGDRDMLITGYDPTTGRAEVSPARINGVVHLERTTEQGELYKLITNYLVCDAFCFYYRSEPELELSYEITPKGLEIGGRYSQAQGVALQSWKMTVTYESIYGEDAVLEHETRFTQEIADIFPYYTGAGKVCCEIVTQDGYTKQVMLDIPYTTGETEQLEVKLSLGELHFDSQFSDAVFIWRWEGFDLRYVGSDKQISRLAGRGREYKYVVVRIDSEGNVSSGRPRQLVEGKWVEQTYINSSRTWTLTELLQTGEHSYRYGRMDGFEGETYEFSVDVQSSAIETVTGSAAYRSEGRFPKYIRGQSRYDTGSFTALLGSVSSPEAGAAAIEKWCEFISRGGPYLLKTDSGDVKIVAITGNPARQYGSSPAELGLTRVTYTWVEIDDIERAEVSYGG